MKTKSRLAVAGRKLHYYRDEVLAVKDGKPWEIIVFGLLVVVLFPLFLLEVAWLLLTGIDVGLFQSSEPVIDDELKPDEVPEALRDLVPLAKKWGIGDDGERGDRLAAASEQELAELQSIVGPRVQQVADWLDTFSEHQLAQSATAGYFLYLISSCDEADVHRPEH